MVLSNAASHQALLRTLDGLSHITGDETYRGAALDAARYALTNLQDEATGLLYWGGHRMYDALGERTYGMSRFHELKTHYPYYKLFWEADPARTKRFIEGFWNAHVLDWGNLDMNRHGVYGENRRTAAGPRLWEDHFDNAPVFFIGKGLSFANTGSDLFYAATLLHEFTGEEGPLLWAKRMALRYVETRNPATGLGGYQFSEVDSGDRARNQFGDAFCDTFGDRVRESTMLDRTRATRKYASCHSASSGLPSRRARQERSICAGHTKTLRRTGEPPTTHKRTASTLCSRTACG
jgi:pectate lyase